MKREEFEIITIDVLSEGAVVTKNHVTDIRHNDVRAIGIEVSDADSIALSSIRMEIDQKRIFPDGFEISRLVCGDGVAPNHRYYELPEPIPVKQSSVDIIFTEGEAAQVFNAYQVKVYLICNVN